MAEEKTMHIPEPTFENGIWKGGKIDMPDGYYKLGERVLNQFKKFPDFVGQIDGATGTKLTYADMGDKSIRCALWLKEQGVSPGDVVGFCSRNHLDSCIPLYACLYIGAIFNPWWHTCLNEELVVNFVERTQPKVLFITENHADVITNSINKMSYPLIIVSFGKKSGLLSFEDVLKTQNDEDINKFQCTRIEPKDPVLIIYSSGSTSFPKGVLHSYHSVAHMLNYYSNDTTPSTVVWFSGLCWISGTRTVLRSIIFKATMILYHNLSEEKACEIIEKYKVTRLWMGASVVNKFTKLRDIEKYDLSSVDLVTYGDASTSREVIQNLCKLFKNADIYVRYGATECGTVLTGLIKYDKFDSCGKIFFNTEVKVVDLNTKKILGPNQRGELWIRTPRLMLGYWKNLSKTEKVIDSKGWYHSGDLVYYDNDGVFFFYTRIKHTIKCDLFDLVPEMIEKIIQGLPGVAEVSVVAKPSLEYGQIPMAFVTKEPGMEVSEGEIIEAVEKKLSNGVKLLGGVYFLDRMPLTPLRKIAIHELRIL
ncbi:Similar to Luciferin 4-monooxygenase (Photinus pyralis), partial [Cotesia congregata]